KQDFSPLTLKLFETGCECTPRLLSRAGIVYMNIAHLPLPERIVEQWARSMLLNAFRGSKQHRGVRDVADALRANQERIALERSMQRPQTIRREVQRVQQRRDSRRRLALPVPANLVGLAEQLRQDGSH